MRRTLACLLACLMIWGQVVPGPAFAEPESANAAWEHIAEEMRDADQTVPEAVSLEIIKQPDKTQYRPGEVFDPAGMEAKVCFSDGSEKTVTEKMLTWTSEPLTLEDTGVTVFYEEVSTEVEIQVVESLDGNGTQENPYLLAEEEDIRLLDEWTTAGDARAAACFRMTGDIELTEPWDGIGDEDTPFTGDFDGGGHQITIPVGGKALFARTRGAVIHDLKVYGPEIEDYGLVSVYETDKKAEYYAIFRNVTLVSGTRTLKAGFLGGYASGEDQVLIENCAVEDGVTIGYDGSQSHIGSFAGEMNGTIRGCSSSAVVYGTDWVGGLVGNKGQSMGDFVVDKSTFSGEVYASGKYVGGIVGGGYGGTNWGLDSAPNARGVTIRGCVCDGYVSGGNGVGGILGAEACVQQFWDNGVGYIQDNRFTGSISADGDYLGGIIGYMQSMNANMIISNNYYQDADEGIGAVAHVDTSAVANGFQNGTYYYDTSKHTGTGRDKAYLQKINCVSLETHMELSTIGAAESGVNRAVSKFDLNREDDPLGADKDRLCRTDGTVGIELTDLTMDGSCKTQYMQGEALDLTGLTLTAVWNNGETRELTPENVSVSGYDPQVVGEQTIRLRYRGREVRLTVTVQPQPTAVSVSVKILGDGYHKDPFSSGGPHGLARGGLVTWAEENRLSAETTETVWDVLKRVLDAESLSYQADTGNKYGTVYITAINGLAERDNGPNSGWMYTVNGKHPEVGVSARYISNGDKIVLHYTDDYSYEEGGSNYGKPVERSGYEKVILLIEQVGTVSYTEESLQKLLAARIAYNALRGEDQDKVTNYAKLTAGEKSYAKNIDDLITAIGKVTLSSEGLIGNAWNAYNALPPVLQRAVSKLSVLLTAQREWNQLRAEQVAEYIEKIGVPATEKDLTAVEAARKAYEDLTEEQQRLVTNFNKLAQAETALAKLTATKEDKEKAQAVADRIQKLGTITVESENAIREAREAYDGLTALQKKLVENAAQLESAETKLAVLKAMGKVSVPFVATGDYMENLGTPAVGPIGGEWMVIGLARSGRTVPDEEKYYEKALQYIKESIDPNTQRLHKAKSTENARMILALTAMGKDASNIGGYDLLQGLSDFDYVCYQGNNGPIWALLALDSGNYPVPEGATATRKALIGELLRVQTSDGGWAITGDKADSDMTGMALSALAPYYKEDLSVQKAIDRALVRLSEMQDTDGGFSASYGNENRVATSESVSQVVTALSALGIDGDTDPRFVKDGGSAIDALLRYSVSGGGFRHVMDGKIDGMATEQAYYALTAYYRLLSGKTRLYDMTDLVDMGGDLEEEPEETSPATEMPNEEPVEEEASSDGVSWWWLVVCFAGAYALGMATTVVITPKLRKKKNAKNQE